MNMDTSIAAQQWKIRSQHRPILSEEEHEALVCWLGDTEATPQASGIPACGSVVVKGTPMQLPEILFGNNALELHHEPSGFLLQFDARGALEGWVKLFTKGTFEVIKVREARQWQTRLATPVRQQEYDWTWGTDYAGSCCQKGAGDENLEDGNLLTSLNKIGEKIGQTAEATGEWVTCEPGGIDRQLLRDQSSPILMYDDVVLFEDFIHDHGVVRMSVKTRTMPQCWYVLLRYWLRVDGVVMKVFDTRYFHKFGERSVYRERTQHVATFTSLQERGLSTDPSVYSDADAALPVLELSSGPLYDEVVLNADGMKSS